MKIGEMFLKPIDRDIKGVIKVGQDDSANVYQELDEYVVTKELSKHFRDFFESYKKGINGHTDKMGVWISGFFGSGKSHFLKILAYLLENREVNGKRAVDFFTEGNKISDPMIIANMNLAGNLSTDVILFNIDSKGSSKATTSKDAIIEVFMKVFNEMQGYCGSMPFLADFERQLSSDGVYDTFKAKFKEITGNEWEEKRQAFFFIQDNFIKTITALNIMSEEAARVWCKNAKGSYDLSIEKFADLVRKYCESKNKNHHVVFLVDEIGQYIAEDERLMLNLQTVTEDLGTACGGKAWIIVTSQQDIDSFTKVKGNDFSKIQGRFDIRLSLSSANVDEVIRKRILAKNQTASETLRLLYDQKESILKNLITFTADTADKRLYADRGEFAAVYPFIPYQFNLLGQVLTSIREHGASGKHLAEGERSMIALFKESAMAYKDDAEGILVPFNIFYNALDKFIDHTHSVVISHARDNSKLYPFDVELLKVLFMIKYVKEIKGNVENLTTLMVTSIDEDRIALKKNIEESLARLANQTLVQKNGEIYIFLTNEEQDINKAIQNENVEMGEIINQAASIIFQELMKEPKYRYIAPHNGRKYDFTYNQIVDSRFFKNNQGSDIGVKIITPYNESDFSAEGLRMLSMQENNVIVHLPDDSTFLDEITGALKISKFITKQSGSMPKSFESIKIAKQDEFAEKTQRIRIFIEEALKNADIYVNGDQLSIAAKDPVSRINEALAKLVKMRYSKLSYMETTPALSDIDAIFRATNQTTLGDMGDRAPNGLALADVLQAIELNSIHHVKTSLKSLMDRFSGAPYGFAELDIQWLVAMLFKQGKVSFTVNSQNISLVGTAPAEIIRIVTRRENIEKLLIEKREHPGDGQIKAVKDVMKGLFGIATISDEDDALIISFQNRAKSKSAEIEKLFYEYREEPRYPGKHVLTDTKKLLDEIDGIMNPIEFFRTVDARREDLLDIAEELAPVTAFFSGEQKAIFKKACSYIDIYNSSKTYVVDQGLIDLAGSIRDIISRPSPYAEIHKLPALLDAFSTRHVALLEQEAEPIRAEMEADKAAVLDALKGKEYADKFKAAVINRFDELKYKLEHSNEVAAVKNMRLESDALKVRFLQEFADYARKMAPPIPPVSPAGGVGGEVAPPPATHVKKKKPVSIKSIIVSNSVSLESEQDIDIFISTLKMRLMKELDEDTVINLLM